MAYTHRALPDRSTTLFVQRRFHTPPSFPILPFSTFSCACAHYRIPWYVSGDAGNRPRNTMQATAGREGSDKIGISNCYVENARWDPRLFCTQPPDRGAHIYPPPPRAPFLLLLGRTTSLPLPPPIPEEKGPTRSHFLPRTSAPQFPPPRPTLFFLFPSRLNAFAHPNALQIRFTISTVSRIGFRNRSEKERRNAKRRIRREREILWSFSRRSLAGHRN